MPFAWKHKPAAIVSLFLLVLFVLPLRVRAQTHVVSPETLQDDVAKASLARQSNLQKLDHFFSSPSAQASLKSAHMDPKRVKKAVRELSDADLAEFAARTDAAQHEFAAGALTNQQITYILIALATAVIILVIVKA
jgi:hypothetical protein